MLGRMLDEDEDETLDVETLGRLEIPANLDAVAAAIDQMQSIDPESAFQQAQMDLDRVVAGRTRSGTWCVFWKPASSLTRPRVSDHSTMRSSCSPAIASASTSRWAESHRLPSARLAPTASISGGR